MYNQPSTTPSSQIDSPSNTINALTTSNSGLGTKDSTALPKKKDNKTSKGKSPSVICNELLRITLTA